MKSYCKASLFNFTLLTKEANIGHGKKSLLEQIKQNAVEENPEISQALT